MDKKSVATFRYKTSQPLLVITKIEFVDLEFLDFAVVFTKSDGNKVLVPYANVAYSIEFTEEAVE